MAHETQRLTPEERANLVAYLDGELNEAESRAISTKLTQSATARGEIELLRKTWELLDHLPRPTAPEHLTERTLSGARRLDERSTDLGGAIRGEGRKALRASLWVAASMIAFLGGFAAVRWAWPDPTTRLARELPLIEHLDEYRAAGSFDFLNELSHSPEFGSGPSD